MVDNPENPSDAKRELKIRAGTVDEIVNYSARLLELLYRSTQFGGLLRSQGYEPGRNPSGELTHVLDVLAADTNDRQELIYEFQQMVLETAKKLGEASDDILEFFSKRVEARVKEHKQSQHTPGSRQEHVLVELKNRTEGGFTLTNHAKSKRFVCLPEFVEFDGCDLFRVVGLFGASSFELGPDTNGDKVASGDTDVGASKKDITVTIPKGRTLPSVGKYWCTIELDTPDISPRFIHIELKVSEA